MLSSCKIGKEQWEKPPSPKGMTDTKDDSCMQVNLTRHVLYCGAYVDVDVRTCVCMHGLHACSGPTYTHYH